MEEGVDDGVEDGVDEGVDEGVEEGVDEGVEEGVDEGVDEGVEEGVDDGVEDGVEDGVDDGVEDGVESLMVVDAPSVVVTPTCGIRAPAAPFPSAGNPRIDAWESSVALNRTLISTPVHFDVHARALLRASGV